MYKKIKTLWKSQNVYDVLGISKWQNKGEQEAQYTFSHVKEILWRTSKRIIRGKCHKYLDLWNTETWNKKTFLYTYFNGIDEHKRQKSDPEFSHGKGKWPTKGRSLWSSNFLEGINKNWKIVEESYIIKG